MRTTAALVVALFGCEHIEPASAPPKPPLQPIAQEIRPAVALKEPVVEAEPVRAPRVIEERRDGLPNPPTDEPVAYAAWFVELPRATQRKINSVCRAKPRSYQYVCGG